MSEFIHPPHPDYAGTLQHLTLDQFRARAAGIRLVLSDNDGVLTDTGVYYSERGEELKRYSIRDGMGVERLRAAGVRTGIMTGEISPNLRRRAEKLRIEHLELGVKDKQHRLRELLIETGMALENVAYIGDDVNDLDVMDAVSSSGIIAAPADAMPLVRARAQYVCEYRGGHGAFREFAEVLLRHLSGQPLEAGI
jgi:3-deoxy-D-manno-octulosonate 8-phosphate phosphatase (KDO 8-P phosphatase)